MPSETFFLETFDAAFAFDSDDAPDFTIRFLPIGLCLSCCYASAAHGLSDVASDRA